MGVNLTNQFINQTFQKLTQVSGSSLTDGTGSLITSLDISSSYATTADTASFFGDGIITASAVSSTITFTKDNGTTFDVIVAQSGSVESASYAATSTSASHALFANLAADANDLIVGVKNTLGVTITKGQTLHATGVTGQNIDVITASCDGDMPAIGLALTNINASATGNAIISGKIVGVDTSTKAAGEPVYVGQNGSLTGTKPTGSAFIQNIGIVGKVDASDGEIVVMGAGRTNDLPNLTTDYIWKGDANGVPQAVASSSIIPTTANTASYVAGANVNGTVASATSASFATNSNTTISASHAVQADSSITATSATTATSASHAVQADSATSSSHAVIADSALSSNTSTSASFATTAASATSASHAIQANNANTATSATTATSASHAVRADIADDLDSTARINITDITASNASFTSASIGYLKTITGSATIIGDEYIILNADSPTKRFAGIKVYDSGSGLTGSFEWDSVDDNWIQVETGGESAGMLTGPSGSKGSEVYPTANTLIKGTGNHTVVNSSITDNGSVVNTNSDLGITGSVTIINTSNTALKLTPAAGASLGEVIIEAGPDYVNKFTPSSIRGIENYEGVMLTGSDFQVGNVDGNGVGVRNKTEGLTSAEQINLFHGSGNYSSFISSKNNNYIKFRGDTVEFYGSGSLSGPATSGVSMQVYGDVTASNFLGTASYATNADTASYVNTLNQDVTITGSLNVTSSLTMNGAFRNNISKQPNAFSQFDIITAPAFTKTQNPGSGSSIVYNSINYGNWGAGQENAWIIEQGNAAFTEYAQLSVGLGRFKNTMVAGNVQTQAVMDLVNLNDVSQSATEVRNYGTYMALGEFNGKQIQIGNSNRNAPNYKANQNIAIMGQDIYLGGTKDTSYTFRDFTQNFEGDTPTKDIQLDYTGSVYLRQSGSIAGTPALIVTGSVTATSFTGSLSGTATTASYVEPLTQNVQITGSLNITGSARNASKLNGNLFQTFPSPGNNSTVSLMELSGTNTIGGKNYTNKNFFVADFNSFGNEFKDYFSIEYYDGFGYNYGTELNVNGIQSRFGLVASGSSPLADRLGSVDVRDNQNGTGRVRLLAGNDVDLVIRSSNRGTQITGSVYNEITALSIASNTASLDCQDGDMFTLTLQNGIDTHLDATNIRAGQTISLQVTNNATSAGTLSFSPDFKFAGGTAPTVTATTSAKDIITFQAFDASSLNGTAVLNLS